MKSMRRQKDTTLKDKPPARSVGLLLEKKQRDSSRRNEKAEPKQKGRRAVDVSAGESKVQCHKEQYCIGT